MSNVEFESKQLKINNHMALLRNLRNILKSGVSERHIRKVCVALVEGAKNGRQFPFRYYTAKEQIEKHDYDYSHLVLEALDDCIETSLGNMPKLKGKTMCLSDNSGSAWGTFNSEYGSVTVADIANLSSVITAKNSDEGYVGVFGDRLKTIPIKKSDSILLQHYKVNNEGSRVGKATEGGVWEFFNNAIEEKQHWDNIFIYSDMQVGHGELYGNSLQNKEYSNKGYSHLGRYINVIKLIEKYRRDVNDKVNIYCVQVAGYNNSILPENLYRTSILSGWSGKELIYADKINKLWDKIDNNQSQE